MTIFFSGPNFTNNDIWSSAAPGIRSSFTSLSDKHLFRFSLLQKYQVSVAFSVLLNLPLCSQQGMLFITLTLWSS